MTVSVVGRLAPTPSGRLHLGNVCAFAAAWLSARQRNGSVLLRIEDIDRSRSRPALEDELRVDLTWLGLDWDLETPRQSDRDYAEARAALVGRTYACRCTRRMLQASAGAGGCRCRDAGYSEGAIRLRLLPGTVRFVDRVWGEREVDPGIFGDPILWGRDGQPSYNLAVVVDDERDGVTEVARGADLLDYTAVQISVRQALGVGVPTWLHAPLVLGPDGMKLSKSHGSAAVAAMRKGGSRPGEVWSVVLPWLGLSPVGDIRDAIPSFDATRIGRQPVTVSR